MLYNISSILEWFKLTWLHSHGLHTMFVTINFIIHTKFVHNILYVPVMGQRPTTIAKKLFLISYIVCLLNSQIVFAGLLKVSVYEVWYM